MYDPTLGTFVERDPITYSAEDVNLYRYAASNGTNATDPSGLITFNDWLKKHQNKSGCASMTRGEFELFVARNYYQLTLAQLRQLDRGCIGLCAVNQSPNPKSGPYENRPEEALGTECYLSEAEAKKRKCAPGEFNFVFAKWGQWRYGEKPKPGADGTVPRDSIAGIGSFWTPDDWFEGAGPYDFVPDYIESGVYGYWYIFEGLYFKMNFGKAQALEDNLPQRVVICRNSPKLTNVIWCSTCKCASGGGGS